MAKVVGGFRSSHSPLMSLLSGELWEIHAQNDPRNGELVKMPEGKRVTYDELLTQADPAIATVVNREVFDQRIDALQSERDLPRGEGARHQRHDQHHRERDEVLCLVHDEREVRRYEQEVEGEDGEEQCERRGQFCVDVFHD